MNPLQEPTNEKNLDGELSEDFLDGALSEDGELSEEELNIIAGGLIKVKAKLGSGEIKVNV